MKANTDGFGEKALKCFIVWALSVSFTSAWSAEVATIEIPPESRGIVRILKFDSMRVPVVSSADGSSATLSGEILRAGWEVHHDDAPILPSTTNVNRISIPVRLEKQVTGVRLIFVEPSGKRFRADLNLHRSVIEPATKAGMSRKSVVALMRFRPGYSMIHQTLEETNEKFSVNSLTPVHFTLGLAYRWSDWKWMAGTEVLHRSSSISAGTRGIYQFKQSEVDMTAVRFLLGRCLSAKRSSLFCFRTGFGGYPVAYLKFDSNSQLSLGSGTFKSADLSAFYWMPLTYWYLQTRLDYDRTFGRADAGEMSLLSASAIKVTAEVTRPITSRLNLSFGMTLGHVTNNFRIADDSWTQNEILLSGAIGLRYIFSLGGVLKESQTGSAARPL